MNWLGGLQVWSESARSAQLNDGQPDSPGEWLWVKPKKGCAIINLGTRSQCRLFMKIPSLYKIKCQLLTTVQVTLQSNSPTECCARVATA